METQRLVFIFFVSYQVLVRLLRALRYSYIQRLAAAVLATPFVPGTGAAAPLKGAAKKSPHPTAWQVYVLSTGVDLEFERELATSIRGLFLTYTIPSISRVLAKTGGFGSQAPRRYADMELLISEFLENAADGTQAMDGQPERAWLAIRRLNTIHNAYSSLIVPSGMLYVLSVFMTSLAMWCDDRPRWAVRRHSAAERECSFRLWCVIGAQMRIPGISSWACFDDAVAFRLAYEAAHSRPAATNSAITASTVDFFAAASPGFIRPGLTRVMLRVVSALQASSKHVEAMGLPPPGVAVPLALDALLTLRATAAWLLLPPTPVCMRRKATAARALPPLTGCPFARRSLPSPLSFGNKTYTKETGYIVENLGSSAVKKGVLVDEPVYAGKMLPGE